MINYKIITFEDIKRSDVLKEQLKKDCFEKTSNEINVNCINDLTYAFRVMTRDRKYIMIADSLVDYEKGRAYTKDTINDEIVEELLKSNPQYAQYFEVNEKVSQEADKPKRKTKR